MRAAAVTALGASSFVAAVMTAAAQTQPAPPAQSTQAEQPAQAAPPAPTPSSAPTVPSAQPPLGLAVQVEKLVAAADGGAALVPATSAAPGDTLLYTVTFTNATAGALDRVRITQAIPPGVVYVAGTAVAPGALALFSVDGGETFGLPAELAVTGGDGVRRAAAPADYTHVRWLLAAPLGPRATGFARFRAELR